MITRLVAFLSPRAPTEVALQPPPLAPTTIAPTAPPRMFEGTPVPDYPEAVGLVPAIPPNVLLEGHAELIGRLRQSVGLAAADFDRRVLPVLERYAARVHLLPASESDHHCGRGGLLRHGLEAAFFAARLADSRVFGLDAEPEYRKSLDPKWRLATVFAALLHDLGKAVVDVNAVSEDGRVSWNGHGQSLWDWLQATQLPGYYIHWNPGKRGGRHHGYGPVLMREILGVDTIEYLSADGAREVMDKMVLAFTQPESKSTNVIALLAARADHDSAEFDLEDQARRAVASGGNPARSKGMLLLRAMGRLIESGEWRINHAGHPLWLTADGLFGVIPDVFRAPVDLLNKEGRIKGFPRETDQILELLSHHRFLTQTPEGGAFWVLDVTSNGVELSVNVVRFAVPDALLGDQVIAPAPGRVRAPGTPVGTALQPQPTPVETTEGAKAHAASSPALAAPPTTAGGPTEPQVASTNTATAASAGVDGDQRSVAAFLAQVETANGTSGMWLRGLLERFVRRECTWGKDAAIVDGRVIFAYPKVFAGLGMEPAALRNQLNDAGWLVMDAASQRLVVEVAAGSAKLSGTFGSDGFTHLAKELLQLHPEMGRPAAGDGTNTGDAIAIPACITAAHLSPNMREVSVPLRIALKRQIHAQLRAAKLNAKSDMQSLAPALREACTQRNIHNHQLLTLLSATPNPLLIETKAAHEAKGRWQMNADYSRTDDIG